MEQIKRKSKIIILYIFAFLAIYTPNFAKIAYFNNMVAMFILMILLLPEIITKFRNVKQELFSKKILYLIGGILLASCYFAIRALFAGANLTDIADLRIVQSNINIIFILLMIMIIKNLSRLGYNREKKVTFLLNIAMIQGIICMIMYIFPATRTIVTDVLFRYGEGNEFTLAARVYGIASNYTFATPIFHGILGTIAVIYAMFKNKKYILYLPFIVIAIILNGRTGFFILILGIVISLGYFIMKMNYAKKVLKMLLIFIPIMILVMLLLNTVFSDIFAFTQKGINDVINLMNGEKTGNFGILYNDYLLMPEVNPIFGEGYRPHGTDIPDWITEEYRTDMGYINDYVMGGILYMLLLYVPYIKFIMHKPRGAMKDIDKSINQLFSIFILLTLAITGIKGEPLRATIIVAGMVYLKLVLTESEPEKIGD